MAADWNEARTTASDGESRVEEKRPVYDRLSRAELIDLLERRDREGARIGLNWAPDKAKRDRALNDEFVTLRLIRELCGRPAPWENMLIEGENFDALRWLRMTLRGRVKAIYADPPYNTGNGDWVYNDRYHDPGDPFFQTAWLEFLHRRFALARDLLADDGVLLVSINDENRAVLEMMLDQTLPGMKVGSLVWRTRTGGNEGGRAFLSGNHEHILVYGGPAFRFGGREKSFAMYRHWDEARQDYYRLDNLTQPKDMHERPNGYYPLRDPATDIYYPCNPSRVWPFTNEVSNLRGDAARSKTMDTWIDDRRIHFPIEQHVDTWKTIEDLKAAVAAGDVPRSGSTLKLWADMPDLEFWVGKRVGFGTPAFKRYKSELKNERQPLSSWFTPRAEQDTIPQKAGAAFPVVGTNDEGAKILKKVFGAKVFNYAKPVSLVRELIRQSTGPGDIVVDFFAGSGTTGQAVMELNAEDAGGRRFVLVSHDEKTDDAPDRNLARDVMRERVRLLNERAAASEAGGPAPFAYLRTCRIPTERLMDEDSGLTPEDIWLAVQAMHGLPLSPYDASSPLQLHESDDAAVAFCDTVGGEALARLTAIADRRKGIQVYAWTVGPIRRALEGRDAEFHRLPDALWQRFKS